MRRLLPVLIGAVVAIGCTRLGIWQVSRLTERRALNAEIEARRSLPAVRLTERWVPDSLVHRGATVDGVFDESREVVLAARSLNATPGVHVVTPLLVADGSAVLVERGWIYSPDGRAVDLEALSEESTTRVEGVFLPPPTTDAGVTPPGDSAWPRYVLAVDARFLRAAYPYPIYPLVLRRTTPARAEGLRAVPPLALNSGPHLSYAIQWFAFGAIALVGSIILAARTPPRSEESTPTPTATPYPTPPTEE